MTALFETERRRFHQNLLEQVLTIDKNGVASNADSSSKSSKAIARNIADQLKSGVSAERIAGQSAGNQFEIICRRFIADTFNQVTHLRPGRWAIEHVAGRSGLKIAEFEQYAHLVALDKAARSDRELAAILGSDYTISPDIVVSRKPEPDTEINRNALVVDDSVARRAPLREKNQSSPILHASVSCKWTIRSDRAQNSRSEALNLIRNRKGHLPHIVVITGEPLPSRIASIALGTGDIDCVYHFALTELINAIEEVGSDDAKDMLNIMIDGRRLRDISDLPLDLSI